MAEKKGSTIVIKKITIVAGGGHGGAWKVAFADFMTAMMCFFLVMWLRWRPVYIQLNFIRLRMSKFFFRDLASLKIKMLCFSSCWTQGCLFFSFFFLVFSLFFFRHEWIGCVGVFFLTVLCIEKNELNAQGKNLMVFFRPPLSSLSNCASQINV